MSSNYRGLKNYNANNLERCQKYFTKAIEINDFNELNDTEYRMLRKQQNLQQSLFLVDMASVTHISKLVFEAGFPL